MAAKVTIPALLQMKREARKIVGVVAWDYQIARIADRAGVDLVSVGDSVGMNLWGRSDPEDMTLEEMILVGRAVRLGAYLFRRRPNGEHFLTFEELMAQRDTEHLARLDTERKAGRLAELSRKARRGQATPEELAELDRLEAEIAPE